MATSQETRNKINEYLTQINARFLNVTDENYNPETKTYNEGVFYVHEGLDYFEIRRVNDEKGDYSVIGEGEYSAEECLACLAGLFVGNILTLDLVDMEFEEEEITPETLDSSNLSDESKEAARKLFEAQAQDIADRQAEGTV